MKLSGITSTLGFVIGEDHDDDKELLNGIYVVYHIDAIELQAT